MITTKTKKLEIDSSDGTLLMLWGLYFDEEAEIAREAL